MARAMRGRSGDDDDDDIHPSRKNTFFNSIGNILSGFDEDNVNVAPIMTDKDVLEFVQDLKSSNNDVNEMNKTAPVSPHPPKLRTPENFPTKWRYSISTSAPFNQSPKITLTWVYRQHFAMSPLNRDYNENGTPRRKGGRGREKLADNRDWKEEGRREVKKQTHLLHIKRIVQFSFRACVPSHACLVEAVISAEKQRSAFDQVSEFDRGRIVVYRDCGLSFREIGSRVGRNQTTVMRICDHWMQ
ncbi:HTH_38 domain-containing protein [Trichonephila clavipes]|nr:HTH_38 domain-containing protein [Trichonephila clavipes]